MNPPSLLSVLSGFLYYIPYMIVWAVGFILAIVRWQRHPKVSLLAVIAFTIFFMTAMVNSCLRMWLYPWLFGESGGGLGQTSAVLILSMINLSVALAGAGAWVLVLIAIFGWRETPAQVGGSAWTAAQAGPHL